MLSKYFINKSKDKSNSNEYIGKMTTIIGVIVNLILSIIKVISGIFFNSISILADGINNLGDVGNSLILLISFKLSNKEADEKHPYGHERMEYLASIALAVSIVFLSIEMFKTSIDKILHPTSIDFSIILVFVLIVSILGKYMLYLFYKKCANEIHSTILHASALDSISDVYSTTAVFVSLILYQWFHINLDGVMGIFVGILILKSGISIIQEAANKLLGEAPNAEFVSSIKSRINNYEGVLGVHDLLIHSYGRKIFASVHVEVDSRIDVLISHDLIDGIEKDFEKEGIHLVIHLDPIILDNPILDQIKEEVLDCLFELSDQLQIHDFRAIIGIKSIVFFDCMIPYTCKIRQSEIENYLNERFQNKNHEYKFMITFERPYNG